MRGQFISEELLLAYRRQMVEEEKSTLTVEKYLRDLKTFCQYAGEEPVTKALVIQYKEKLLETYAVSSVNSMLAALNRFFTFAGWHECRVKQVRQQRTTYCPQEKELSKKEYYALLAAAKRTGKERLELVMQTICSTGIRISELQNITVEAVRNGSARVACKGKVRQIWIPGKLKLLLLSYCKRKRIRKGPVFVTSRGLPLNRSNVWREMKKLCQEAKVGEGKVFPHNLRHLFARTYYRMEKDLSKLADLLGHSNINTTRIYITTSGREHRRQLEKMKLLL